MSVEEFWKECQQFASRLLETMKDRLAKIEVGIDTPQVMTNNKELIIQHESWARELSDYLVVQEKPDIPWKDAETAFRILLSERKKENVEPTDSLNTAR